MPLRLPFQREGAGLNWQWNPSGPFRTELCCTSATVANPEDHFPYLLPHEAQMQHKSRLDTNRTSVAAGGAPTHRPPAAAQQDAALRAGGSYQSREERNSQVPEVIVQQAAVHHVPKDGDAS